MGQDAALYQVKNEEKGETPDHVVGISLGVAQTEPTGNGSSFTCAYSLPTPSGILYFRLQEFLKQDQMRGYDLLPLVTKRHPGPTNPRHDIPHEEWSVVLRRVVDNQEPLRKVADDYGVSYEAGRRVLRAARKGNAG